MSNKASLPQGTRDFGPEVVRKRNYIFNTIRTVFELYGFQPLETPAMENLETLIGKYGEEGDRLIFKILNNGLDNPTKSETILQDFEKVMEGKNVKGITERALRYDLTIPFARYVAMNYNQLPMPFKRYQMQPVWRADRPQRGRYREFYQCDADVVGSTSLWNETELASIYATVFQKLGISVEVKINSRKILAALAELCGGADKLTDITIAIDKLDKIGIEKVKEELAQRGLEPNQISIIENYLTRTDSNETELARMKELLQNNSTGQKGIEEIETVLNRFQLSIIHCQLSIDFTLARGLNYYTGIIFEVKAKGVQMGSIGGGGRYDDLTGLFGVPNVPGVGISFGVDRIYDVMEELKLFPEAVQTGTQVLFFNLGESESSKAFELAQQLREQGIRSELYPEKVKLDKQFKYAEKKDIPYVAILGTQELDNGTVNLKDLRKGEQISLQQDELAQFKFLWFYLKSDTMSAVPVIKYSIQDYLEIEASTGKRYEFYDGELFEVEGASVEHNRIVAHTFGEVYTHLKGRSCEVFTSQLKVESKFNNSITYPDITIVCNELELSKQSKDIITNPSVIIEVVSPSTADYDHGKKFRMYRALPSLKEYILISSTEVLIEKFTKQDNKMWLLEEYKTLESTLSIGSIGLQIPLVDIYADTDLPVYED